jgi:acyl-ACP thioesterase
MKKGEYVFKVRSYECGADGFASAPTVCNYLQEAASLNAEELGFSKSDFDARGENISWVLTRLVVEMKRYPSWEEETKVITFPRGGRKIVAWRDFEIKDANGETLGLATSEWMLIDLSTRKIMPIPENVLNACEFGTQSVLGVEPFTARLKFPSDAAVDRNGPYKAQHSHIDLNGHVNNVHYVEWLLEPLKAARPSRLELVFRSETLAEDEIFVETTPGGEGETYHKVCSPDGKDHIVAVVRA